jgi:CheY-like chemotaxis protein
MITPSLTRILFVDDEEDIRSVAKLALEAVGGFAVEVYGSGSEAVKRASAFVPDLILLDVMMPGMDGASTLKALRKLPETAGIPVIFLTASVQTHETAHYKEIGAIDVIPKPFDPMTLSDKVIEIWRQHHG